MRLVENVPDITDVIQLTDWVEMLILVSSKNLTKSQLRDYLTAAGDISTSQADEAIGFVSKEIRKRAYHIGVGYPFSVDATKIIFSTEMNCDFYKYFLLISISVPFRTERRQGDVNTTFDNVTRRAAEVYLGAGTRSLRFGWPPSDGRPSNFSEALDWLCQRMGLTRGSGDRLPTTNDGGLDVIAWKPFADGKRPFLVLLLQSTVQIDWFSKIHDITQCVWQGWIDTGKEPMIGLAIPFVVARNYRKRDELSRTVHLLLERTRLTFLLHEQNPNDFPEMVAWNRAEIQRIAIE